MRIRTRIQFIIVLSVVMVATVGLLLFLSIHAINEASRKAKIADEVEKGVIELKILTSEYLLHPGDRSLIQWRSRYDFVIRRLKGGYFRSPDEKTPVNEILKNLERIKTIFTKITIDMRKKQQPGKQESAISRALQDRLEAELLVKAQAAVSLVFPLQQKIQAELLTTQKRDTFLTILLLFALTTVIVAILLWINKSIVIPIAKLEEDIQIIGSGNLDYKVGTTSKDEIGHLSRTFDKMTRNLKETTASIVELNKEIDERKQAEEALIKSETFLNKTEQIAKVGGWEIDEKTKKVFWTIGLYNITEVPADYDPSSLEKEAIVFFSAEDQLILEKIIQRAFEHNEPYDRVFQITTVKGNKKWAQAICEPIVVDGKVVKLSGTFQDITEQKQNEKQIRASLKEKEILLQEIHHRVKNNMQIIASLLKLQVSNVGDERVTDALIEFRGRVQAMAFVHETLYGSDNLADIDFKTYISKVTSQMFQTFKISMDRIKLEVDAKNITLGIEQGVPLGLITNELVTNSLKYAFPENRSGEIVIRIRAVEKDSIEFIFSDNGIGIPEDLDWRNTDSLGLRLVILLAEDQLDGTVSLDRGKGTHFTVRFRHKENQ